MIHPLAESWGDLIESDAAPELSALDRDAIIERFKRRAALLFRGFTVSNASLRSFTDRFSAATLPALHAGLNRDRVPGEDRTMTVDLGSNLVGYHREMGYSPARPDLLWFHCLAPAVQGGETLLCDGVGMLQKMESSLVARFRDKRIKYVFRGADAALWSLFVGEPVDRDQALRRLERVPGVHAAPGSNGALDLEYVTSAIQPTRYAGVEAFVNSIIIFGSEVVTFEDGEPIDRDLRMEIAALASDCSADIRWRAGDVLLVDNSRLMHGRAPFKAGARRIHVRMSMAAF